jgi:hypothetical protein
MPPNAVALLLITLLPLIPAYVMFRLLPSKAAVTGPFKGLRIDLSGAFAGYFLIFISLIAIRGSFVGPTFETWTVTGQIVRPDIPANTYVDARYVTLSVPSMRSQADGNFSMQFVRSSDGQFDYPHLYITYPDYQPVAYWLGPSAQNDRHEQLPQLFDAKNRKIDLGVVTLAKLASTAAAGPVAEAPANPYSTQHQEAAP